MENNSKKIIIIIILILITIAIIIGILMIIKTNKYFVTDEIEYVGGEPVNSKLERVSIRSNYYTVKNILEKYYSSLCNLNKTNEDILIYEYEGDLDEIKENISNELKDKIKINKNMILSFFENDVVQEIGLSIENIQEKLGDYKDLYIHINDMYVREITESFNIYFVQGNITEKETLEREEFGFMIAVDIHNSTFNIYTLSYVKNHNLYELSKKDDFKEKYFNIENVENRKYNKFKFETIKDETYAKDLLSSYTQSIKYNNIEYSYNKLHEKYKTNRFKDISDYEKYIQDNKENIVKSALKSYKVNKYEDYNQYICMDYSGNYYIFNENGIMNYTLILDTYTVDILEVVEKYNISSDQVKVGMNIEKVLEAINKKDYKYVYSKLDNTFKKNQFSAEDVFEKYMKNNFAENNNIEYLEFSQEGDICIYKTKLNDRDFNIIMQLGEGTEFLMSFSFEE